MGKQRSGQGTGGAKRSGGRRGSRARRRPVDHREVEWRFEAPDLEAVGAWLEGHSAGTGLAVVAGKTEEITDTYHDTDDWRFYRAGYALRVRKKAGGDVEATMKSLAKPPTKTGGTAGTAGEDGSGNNAWQRREITEPLGDDKPATLREASGPVGERLRALAGSRESRPIFEIQTERRTFALHPEDLAGDAGNADGNANGNADGDSSGGNGSGGGAAVEAVRVGEVVLDTSRVPLGEGDPVVLTRVEVEAGEGTAMTPELQGFVDGMQFDLGLRPTLISKYEAGLFAAGLSPETDAGLGSTEVDPSMTVGEVAFAVLRGLFAEMKAHEAGTRLGEDPESLHDVRVATRRMRAAIKLFGNALPERAFWLREELRHVAGSLGEVRDLDVQMERLEAWRTRDPENAEPLGRILDLVKKRREEARGRMLETLDSGRYERFESSFAELLRRGPGADEGLSARNGHDPSREGILSAAPSLLSGRYRSWRKSARRLDETSPAEDYHGLRKEGKKLRYALESLSGVYGGAVEGPVKSLKAVQDGLGRHQDAVVAADLLRELGTTTDGPRVPRATAFAMGLYAERYAREAAEARAALTDSKPFRILLRKGKSWKDLEKTMEKGRKEADKKAKAPKKASS